MHLLPFNGEDGPRAKGYWPAEFIPPVIMQALIGLITFRLSVSTD